MNSIEERNARMAKVQAFNAERIRLAAEYVGRLPDDVLASLRHLYMPSAEKVRKRKPLTGRECHLGMAEPKRKNLLLFQWRAWHAADEPGKSDKLIRWENCA